VQVDLRFYGPVHEADVDAFLANMEAFSIQGKPSVSMANGPRAVPVDGWEAHAPPAPGSAA